MKIEELENKQEVQPEEELDTALWSDKINESDPTVQAMQTLMYDDTPDEIAISFKEQGNKLLKQGFKKQYKGIIESYTRGLEQNITEDKIKVDLLNNRSHVHILMENFGRGIDDIKQVLSIDSKNKKALLRGSKACLSCKKYELGIEFAEIGFKQDSKLFENILNKLKNEMEIENKKKEEKEKEIKKEKEKEKEKLKILKILKEEKKIKIGNDEEFNIPKEQIPKNEFNPNGEILIDNNELLFQVLFVYDDYNMCDVIQQFSENDTFLDHLNEMFPPNGPEFPFGDEIAKKRYYLSNLKLYFWDQNSKNKFKQKFIKFDKNLKLIQLLKSQNYYLPKNLKPIIHIVSSESKFVKEWEN
eukprot:gene10824-3442_t